MLPAAPPDSLPSLSLGFSLVFAAAVLLAFLVRLWLASRQVRHVVRHRDAVPAAFAGAVTPEAHRKAADYTVARARLGVLAAAFGTAVLLGWTLLGGLDLLNATLRDALQPRWGGMVYQLALLAAFVAIASLLDLPFDLYRVFVIEQRYGFNRMSGRLYLADTLKAMVVGTVIGLPLAALVLWIMGVSGGWWWFWAWLAWVGFQLLVLVLYPTVIAPWFNRFEPLADPALEARVKALMARCGFDAKGLYVMDGSRRSAHGNAYFTGFGAAKRVVFFDTLLAKLTPGEVEAVLAHELGHYRQRHVLKRIGLIFALSLAALALLGWLAAQPWFYAGLGVAPNMLAPNDALALLLFMLALPPFAFLLGPLAAWTSRRHEFEADAYAARAADGRDLASALLKLHADNAATLTPDPLYVRFYYSHPPASQRLAALATHTRAPTQALPEAAA
jgi:STE24 endopeptidase